MKIYFGKVELVLETVIILLFLTDVSCLRLTSDIIQYVSKLEVPDF